MTEENIPASKRSIGGGYVHEEAKGIPYDDGTVSKNQYFGQEELGILKRVCAEQFSEEELLPELLMSILDLEAKSKALSNKHNILNNMEKQIKKCFYQNETDAENIAKERKDRQEN